MCILCSYLFRYSVVRFFSGTHANRSTGRQLTGAESTSSSVDSGLGSLDHSNGSKNYSSSVSHVTPLRTRQVVSDSMRGHGQGRDSTHGTGSLHGGTTPAWNVSFSHHNEVV
jgi:hypothetical protein